ncbi:MAG: hypothetical protein BRC44_17755 [Cyanobacteria bacterium QS_4_48_99]|nr:MAG: hypothetical protein BRC44_17755 [Cyanobacteria bacterium QS_4_48_99]
MKPEPGGGQYKEIESVQKPSCGKPLSDAEIENRIKEMRGDLVANVANGSVILSGRVENIEIAREVVKQVKEIPGI